MFETLLVITLQTATLPLQEVRLLAQSAERCDELRVDTVTQLLLRKDIKSVTSTTCRRQKDTGTIDDYE